MPVTNIADLQKSANAALKQAMLDERARRWPQVVQNYRRLLRMLNRDNLPPSLELPSWFGMFFYECYYHLGLALQHVGEHKKAATQYSKSIQAVFIPKNGCTAGCNTSTCLMTPVYARRAIANAITGDMRGALRDAEKAVVLDNRNPDVFCVRALVRSARLESKEALKDVEAALQHNPEHICALILKGGIDQPPSMNVLMGDNTATSEEHKKACSINPDCQHYLGVTEANHEDIIPFYERFLYSLSVPHTIPDIYLPVTVNTHQTQASQLSTTNGSAMSVTGSNNPMKFMQTRLWHSGEETRGFRCGMNASEGKQQAEESIRQRRVGYGQAVREHMTRPRTAGQFIAQLENELMRKEYKKIADRRALVSARPPPPHPRTEAWVSSQQNPSSSGPASRRPLSGTSVASCPPRLNCSRPSSVKAQNFRSAMLNKCTVEDDDHPLSTASLLSYTISKASSGAPASSRDGNTDQSCVSSNNSKKTTISVRAFLAARKMEQVPRMYYRPWSGDKLPVAEVERKTYEGVPFKI